MVVEVVLPLMPPVVLVVVAVPTPGVLPKTAFMVDSF